MDTAKADRLVLIRKKQASVDERERISRRLKSLRKEINSFIGPFIEQRISNCDADLKYITLHLGNAAALAEEVSVLVLNKRNVSVMLLGRNILEECTVISRLINEHTDKKISDFYKYLLVRDMYHDLGIIKETGHESQRYYSRCLLILHTYFLKEIKREGLPVYDASRCVYSFGEKKTIIKAIRLLYNVYKNRYMLDKLCCGFLIENPFLSIQEKQDAKEICSVLCHCSGLNFSSLEDMCYAECDGTRFVSFNNINENLTSVMQWIYYSLSYTFEKAVKSMK